MEKKKIKNQEVYVVSHIICKTTAADSFKTEAAEIITLSPPSQKKRKEYFPRQTERMKTEEPVYYLSLREATHFKAQSLQVFSFPQI